MSPQRLTWLRPSDPPEAFPDVARALRDPAGLLAAGGDLSPARLTAAYRRGIFPWFSAGQPILWWCPDPRTVLVPAEFHASRRLRRRLRSTQFAVSVNQRFEALVGLCAATRADSGTWITAEMQLAYARLHQRGLAHSIEVWVAGELVGGVYGVGLGGAFFGESMVSLVPDASKVALALLVTLARQAGIDLIDCQMPNPHLQRLGSRSLPRDEFLAWLTRAVEEPPLTRLAAMTPTATAAIPELANFPS